MMEVWLVLAGPPLDAGQPRWMGGSAGPSVSRGLLFVVGASSPSVLAVWQEMISAVPRGLGSGAFADWAGGTGHARATTAHRPRHARATPSQNTKCLQPTPRPRHARASVLFPQTGEGCEADAENE
eukprot:gene15566-biopygen23200